MFYQIAQSGPPSSYETERLRNYETTGRLNNVMLESVDLATDILFMLVLFDQAGSISLPDAFQYYKSASSLCSVTPGTPTSDTKDLLFGLGIASAFFLCFNMAYRLVRSLVPLWKQSREITPVERRWALLGVLVSVVDPWNGGLLINSVLDTNKLESSDYNMAVEERNVDVILMLFENGPQLIIQIIYVVHTQVLGMTTIAWYVAIFFTIFHLVSQFHEIVTLTMLLPKLKLLQPAQEKAFSDRQVANADNA